ncbi:MAG: hypothetical protein CSA97_00210 [Bacteroidetes bacterium]|nr:MAG: hypothetical protein CSA97_00210 [Bacteroidota bacterium]
MRRIYCLLLILAVAPLAFWGCAEEEIEVAIQSPGVTVLRAGESFRLKCVVKGKNDITSTQVVTHVRGEGQESHTWSSPMAESDYYCATYPFYDDLVLDTKLRVPATLEDGAMFTVEVLATDEEGQEAYAATDITVRGRVEEKEVAPEPQGGENAQPQGGESGNGHGEENENTQGGENGSTHGEEGGSAAGEETVVPTKLTILSPQEWDAVGPGRMVIRCMADGDILSASIAAYKYGNAQWNTESEISRSSDNQYLWVRTSESKPQHLRFDWEKLGYDEYGMRFPWYEGNVTFKLSVVSKSGEVARAEVNVEVIP